MRRSGRGGGHDGGDLERQVCASVGRLEKLVHLGVVRTAPSKVAVPVVEGHRRLAGDPACELDLEREVDHPVHARNALGEYHLTGERHETTGLVAPVESRPRVDEPPLAVEVEELMLLIGGLQVVEPCSRCEQDADQQDRAADQRKNVEHHQTREKRARVDHREESRDREEEKGSHEPLLEPLQGVQPVRVLRKRSHRLHEKPRSAAHLSKARTIEH